MEVLLTFQVFQGQIFQGDELLSFALPNKSVMDDVRNLLRQNRRELPAPEGGTLGQKYHHLGTPEFRLMNVSFIWQF